MGGGKVLDRKSVHWFQWEVAFRRRNKKVKWVRVGDFCVRTMIFAFVLQWGFGVFWDREGLVFVNRVF
jgi:hypothetical protein